MKLTDITIGSRHRKDLGDIAALAASIEAVGLLHPIVVNTSHELIAGERRLAAIKQLGWSEVPVTVAATLDDAHNAIIAERDENTCRKPFTPSEAVAVGETLEQLEKPKAQERKREGNSRGGAQVGGKLPPTEKAKTRDKVAADVGMSGRTYEKAKAVVAAAAAEPTLAPLVAQMDKSGKVDAAHKQMKRRQQEQEIERRAAAAKSLPTNFRLIHADIAKADIDASSVDWIITDPPYPKEHLEVYDALATFAVKTLKPGGSLVAMVGQSYLPDVLARLIAGGMTYHWTLAYMTPGGQATQLWQRKVNTFWKPLLWMVKGEYGGSWIGDVCQSRVNDNDKRFHHWGQSESGMRDIIERFTKPGEVICDPFCGGGTTGVVAVNLDRQFIGIDIDKEHVRKAELRLKAEAA